MCGIVGIVSDDTSSPDAAPAILEGLQRLEYRGYDSAGIACVDQGRIDRRRAEGKLKALADRLNAQPLPGRTGIGHTRWATHGAANETNAHPHATARVAVVHNGIIENYRELKAELQSYQCRFETETDTEVIPHLITHYMTQGDDAKTASFKAFDRLQGTYSVAVIFSDDPKLMIGARMGTPLTVGYGKGTMYLASDSYALAPYTKDITFLEDGDRAVLTPQGVHITDSAGKAVQRPVRQSAQSGALSGKGQYAHFMLKEIYEQPEVMGDTLNSLINPATGGITIDPVLLDALLKAPRLTLTACGTAYYACMTAKYWFEKLARLPVDVDIASEFRYRQPVFEKNGVALVVSQSGETLDTLEALRLCKRAGQHVACVVNSIESTIERECDHVLRTLAGPEIGVASTKAFTTQLGVLLALALAVADAKGTIEPARYQELVHAVRALPKTMVDVLALDASIAAMAGNIAKARDVLYLGRGLMYPLALEGALKLKEISYIHAEGYAAGEMKHGPIALIDDQVPVIALAPPDELFEKTASNIQEAAARGGPVILVSDAQGAAHLKDTCRAAITLPVIDPVLSPILYALPVQLLAYHAAVAKGTDVDQPRNLAKSVTVE